MDKNLPFLEKIESTKKSLTKKLALNGLKILNPYYQPDIASENLETF